MGSWFQHCFRGNREMSSRLEEKRLTYYEETYLNDVSIVVSLLDNQERYYVDTENGSILKDHVRSMKNGLKFLLKFCLLAMNKELAYRVKQLAADVKHKLIIYEDETGVLDFMKLDSEYEVLRGMMRSLIINPEKMRSWAMYMDFLFDVWSKHNYIRIIDLLLENISEVVSIVCSNTNATADDQTPASVEKVGKLSTAALTYLKPLYRCLATQHRLHKYIHYPFKAVLNEAASAIYLLLVGKMDATNVVSSLQSLLNSIRVKREINIYVNFLKYSSSDVKGQFYILDNLIHIFAVNYDSLNDENKHLYLELRGLRTFVANPRRSERLNHYLGLTASTEAVCYSAEKIVYSFYMKDTDQKLNDILVSVIDQIKLIKCRYGYLEIKLYDYSRVDDYGFLEFFLVHLKELQGHKKMSVIRNSRCISTLSKIVKEVKETKEKLLALPVKNTPVKDVATTSRHVHGMPQHGNNVFVGFQEEIYTILKYLSGGETDLQAISIVGMAGAGKTSLAMNLFKESTVAGHFDTKAWCTVSQSYQTKDLLLTILNQINPFESDIGKIDDQDELADKLCRCLKKRRYLVVIDDVWDIALWNYLSRYFPNDKTQSRILITTRDYKVASETKSKIHELRALTEDESWELLQNKLPRHESLLTNLVSIAKEVAKTCRGLPLSIVVIGGLMFNAERTEEMWNQIAKDVTSTILTDPQGKCKDILELSYNHLPNHLKPCLLYLGVFPEDHEISVTRLVRLLVAEGLVRGEIMSEECMEDVGKRYVNDLITRSLVIPIKEKTEGGVKILQLHDLLHDFCLKKSKEENFFTVLDDRGIFDLSVCPRRISINPDMDKHLPFISLNSVRTLISFCRSSIITEIERIMESGHMNLLNVLDMHELVYSGSYVHCLVNLRYLSIFGIGCSDQVLVQSLFSKLWNLQILILSFGNIHVFEAPDSIWDMVKLRHIHLLPSALFPRHDSKRVTDSFVLLENVTSLSKPCLHYGDSNWLSKLPKLQKLSCIFFYSRDDILLQQYRFPELNLCNRLTSLKVENGAKGNERRRGKLHLPESLRKLSLSEFILDSDDFSELGKFLTNLEVLKLHDTIDHWRVNDEDFLKLKVLKISGTNFHEWDASEDSFPNLEQLWLQNCRSLKAIPLSFGDIPCLRLISIKYCNPSVYDSAKEIEKIQAEALNLELKVNLS